MRGNFRKKKAKVISINLKNSLVTLENMQRSKKDGTKVNVYFHPSNLQIQSLNIDDKKRLAVTERKAPDKKINQEQINKLKEKKDAPKETKNNN